MSSTILPPRNPDQPPSPGSRLSVAEYHRLIDEGILGENDRVELLEGRIVSKMTHNPLHDGMIQIIHKQLSERLPSGYDIRIQSAISTADSEPEPDLAVVRGDERSYLSGHPGPHDVALLIEVAESSLEQDRQEKSRLYARAGITEYWIINLVDSQIEVLTEPTRHAAIPAYGTKRVFRGDELVPLVIEGIEVAQIASKDLLP